MSTNLNDRFPVALGRILRQLEDAGYEARVAGGAVRDLLLGAQPKDWDVATTALPEQVIDIFSPTHTVVPTGLSHGTVTVMDGLPFELTTLRRDAQTDGRHAAVEFHTDWVEDSARRDFTINAMFIDRHGHLYDYHDGLNDLEAGRVEFVGQAVRRIQEDYLRILRFFRFRGRFGSAQPISQATADAIRNHAGGLTQISGERIWMELSRILSGPTAGDRLQEMLDFDIGPAIGIIHLSLFALRDALQFTSNPISLLVAGTEGNLGLLDLLVGRYHVSGEEARLAQFLIDHYDYRLLLQDYQEMAARPNLPKSYVCELASIHLNQKVLDHLLSWTIPIFPVRGQHLIDRGWMPGPQIGAELARLRQRWIESGFVLPAEDLLKGTGLDE